MAAPSQPVIIVRKKKRAHHGHHGGAWKVAYADFVTAMMAFFLVMWLMGQSQEIREAVAGYFSDPGIFAYDGGRSPITGGGAMVSKGKGGPAASDLASATAVLERAAERIRQQLTAIPGYKNLADYIEVKVTAEGLRIELQEGGHETFFDSGSAVVKPQTEQVLRIVARELASLPQAVAIEGHTDAAPFGKSHTYTNWELSADRANAARRIMEGAGLPSGHIRAIRGFADSIPRTPDDPFNPRNRRVSIVVQHATVTPS